MKHVSGAALLVGAEIAAVAAGVVTFFLTAMVTSSVPVFAAAGLAAVAAISWLLGRFALRRLGVPRLVMPYVVINTLAMAALAALTVFRASPVPVPAVPPASVAFWRLPTGSTIAYVKLGGEGMIHRPPVIFLHGGPGTPGEGLPEGSRELAAAGFDVYAYDQLGAGRSTRLADPSGYTVARHVADLEAIRRTIGAQKIILVGRSWGGTLSAAYLATHADHVLKAVLTSPGAIWDPAFPKGIGSPWDTLPADRQARADELTSDPRMLTQGLLLQLNPAAAHAMVPDAEADARMRELLLIGKDATGCRNARPAPVHGNLPGFYSNQMTSADAAAVADPRPKLRGVHVPTLIMRGQCDYLKWEVTYDYRRTLPESTLVYVPGAGHSIANGRPGLYRSLLTAFLLDRPLPRPAYTATTDPARSSADGAQGAS
ncbi:alpha/beta hydrolase [Nonomuraea rhodomycinica]|uniref:prolyl aminopeptidase n=1 Tax=Nonomuraea rhodomycinica TaxID=1712872 RepID=A0A7Y6MEX2_9ACTN|nr:alpha/beta hydrolase [Nonomuraea rhodomycinica]NUW46023.1 alpha/beta hydrolase [Nonomuraea rhodomycinica]